LYAVFITIFYEFAQDWCWKKEILGIQPKKDEAYPVTEKSLGVQGMIFSIYPVGSETVGIGIYLLRKYPVNQNQRIKKAARECRKWTSIKT